MTEIPEDHYGPRAAQIHVQRDQGERRDIQEESLVVFTLKDGEKICWGCGLHLILPSNFSAFKCGWCGAVTNHSQKLKKPETACFSWCKRLRDWLFITVVLIFMLFVICAGVWAVYPVVFSISYLCGIFHSSLTAVLSVCTLSSFLLSSSHSPGAPANVQWGSYSLVQKGGLDDYTYCTYCLKPKPPRAHHCRTCKMCILDMDHHCPFIGNCVGAANHQYFIFFLISVVFSCTYVVAMSVFACYYIWPPLELGSLGSAFYLGRLGATKVLTALADSAMLLSPRGFVLLYLTVAGLSIEIGLSVLLWQQLKLIYEGSTYLNQLNSQNEQVPGERGCRNVLRFFNCPYWAYRILKVSSHGTKLQEASSSKLL